MRRTKWKITLKCWISQAKCTKSRADNSTSLNTPRHWQHHLTYSHWCYFLAPEPKSLSFPLLGSGGWDRTASLPSFSHGSSCGQHTGGSGRHRQPHLWAPAWWRWPSPWRQGWAPSECSSCPSVSYWAAGLHELARSWCHFGPYPGGPVLSQWSLWVSGWQLYIQRWHPDHHTLRWALGPLMAAENQPHPAPVVDKGKD